MIYLGGDHRGFNLKEKIKSWLTDWKFDYEDLGANSLDPNDDYPIYAELVTKKIQKSPLSFGVLICGSGVGVDVAANKFDGIRASLGKNGDQVKAGRHDDNMNVLVLAADFTSDPEASQMLQSFLETKFAGTARFKRRLEEIKEIEENN